MKRRGGFLEGLAGSSKEKKFKKTLKRQQKEKPANEDTSKEIWQSRRKKGRLIVRNLPFKITEDKFKDHFSKFGAIKEVNLLKKPDGKLVGCGFVEFLSREDAANAIKETSGKSLMNRPIIVDWAIPKDVFNNTLTQAIKKEVKEEVLSSDEDEVDKKPELKRTKVKTKKESESSSDEIEDGDESVAEENNDSEESDSEQEKKSSKHPPPPRDVQEGRTIFLKGVPFTARQEELKTCMEKFGPVVYALICTDPVTEHSKGTAFVKFQSKGSADTCLSAEPSQLQFGNSILEPHLAIDRQQLQNQSASQKAEKKGRDGRNLYLVKEGVIQAGSPAAKEVSAADMSKRLQLEQWKTQMLRNLSMIISRNRIVIHNLPSTLDDEGLRKIVKKHAPPNARLFEVRVMRDLRNVDSQGRGVSKEFGFVTFKQHDDALATLRALNNNPSIFTRQKRPVVGFSIENKAILNAKQRRMELSRNKNPYYQREKKVGEEPNDSNKVSKFQPHLQQTQRKDGETNSFSGLEAHPSQTVKLATRGALRSQATIHRQTIQNEKKKNKLQRKNFLEQKLKQRKEVQATTKKEKKPSKDEVDEKAFHSIVNKYRQGLEKTLDLKKWYE